MKITITKQITEQKEVDISLPLYYEYIIGDYHEKRYVGVITETQHIRVQSEQTHKSITYTIMREVLNTERLTSLISTYMESFDPIDNEEFHEILDDAKDFINKL